jgi:hypothetical protein
VEKSFEQEATKLPAISFASVSNSGEDNKRKKRDNNLSRRASALIPDACSLPRAPQNFN